MQMQVQGWCSLWPIMQCLHWQFLIMAIGMYPCHCHDGQPSATSDPKTLLANNPIAFIGALVYLKCHLAEFGSTSGFPSATSNLHPCCRCNTTNASLVVLNGWGNKGQSQQNIEYGVEGFGGLRVGVGCCVLSLSLGLVTLSDRMTFDDAES